MRRLPWVHDGLTPKKAANLATAVTAFLTKSARASAYPPILKVDISPLCNLRCPTCVHADPAEIPTLSGQRLSAAKRMRVEQFASLIREVAGYTCAVSLYYLGDPLAHPDLVAICGVARDAGVNVHVASNLSFHLSDAKIEAIVGSGITHFSASIDGISQATYGRTRVGGDIELVLHNLERIIAVRDGLGARYPKVEVQYVQFRHNEHEIASARSLMHSLGADRFSLVRGHEYNYADVDPSTYERYGPAEAELFPKCFWPYLYMLVRYDGEVIPCCVYRHLEQYAEGGDRHALGNVFAQGVAQVWNSDAYRRTRTLVSDPGSLGPSGSKLFCDGCQKLVVSNYHEVQRPSRVRDQAVHPASRRARLRVVA